MYVMADMCQHTPLVSMNFTPSIIYVSITVMPADAARPMLVVPALHIFPWKYLMAQL